MCELHVPKVNVLYFPDENAQQHCESQGRKVGFVGKGNNLTALEGRTTLGAPAMASMPGNSSHPAVSMKISQLHGSVATFGSLTLYVSYLCPYVTF